MSSQEGFVHVSGGHSSAGVCAHVYANERAYRRGDSLACVVVDPSGLVSYQAGLSEDDIEDARVAAEDHLQEVLCG